MDKNWLIRTKSNHILGPVSKEKVVELYKNGSIKQDDELCSGNGFWFFVREDDMVGRFVLGDEVQGFNPISEAKDVLTVKGGVSEAAEEPVKEDITVVGGISLSMLANDPAPESTAESPPESAPEIAPPPTPVPANVPEPKKKSRPEKVAKPEAPAAKAKHAPPPPKNQGYLKWIGILGFILLFCLIYFRNTIIRSLFQGEVSVSFSLIDEARAQEAVVQKKKSSTVPIP